MEQIFITCKYSCDVCGVEKASVSVPVREASQDVVFWLERIAAVAIAADHQQRSPDCQSRMISNLMIPIDGRDKIGGPTKQ